MKKSIKNRSVKNLLLIAKQYGYKTEVIRYNGCKDLGFLRLSDPFYKSPYGNTIDSVDCSYRFIKNKLEEV